MTREIDRAIASLTPDSHADALRIMHRAGVPIAVISRVVFSGDRLRGRRRDMQTAQVFDQALAIARLQTVDEAEAYLTLKNLAAGLVMRVLSDGPHRGDPERQAQRIAPSPDAPANLPQRPKANVKQPASADILVPTFPRRREVMSRRHGIRRLHSVVCQVVNWLRLPRAR